MKAPDMSESRKSAQATRSLASALGNLVLAMIIGLELMLRLFQIPGNRTDDSWGFKILPFLMLVFPWVNILAAGAALLAARRPRLLMFTRYAAASGVVCAGYLAVAIATYFG